jgi:predicted ATPase
VLVSAATVDAAEDALAGIGLTDLGRFRLKDFDEPVRLHQLIHPELPTDLPPLRTLPETAYNLRLPRTTFVGRTDELVTLSGLISQNRLVSVVGPGGCGKTRLVVEVVPPAAALRQDGAWVVELAGIAPAPDAVARAIAGVLGVEQSADAPVLDGVLGRLRTASALLVLDNCEHLLDDVADVCDAVLGECRNVAVLTTSREPIAVPGEVVFRLTALALPDGAASLDQLLAYDAARLLVDRATLAHPGFTPTEADADAIARICRRLDGMPLALELAAARLSSMTLPALAQAIEDGMPLSGRGRDHRQRTLHATLDWSHTLLEPTEQTLWRRLAVFTNGFTVASVQHVCTDDALPPARVVPLLAGLVDKSLVARVPGRAPGERYALHEIVREYCLGQLASTAETDTFFSRHATWAAELAERMHEGVPTNELVVPYADERDNLLAAWRWSGDHDHGEAFRWTASVLAYLDQTGSRVQDALQVIGTTLAAPLAPTPASITAFARAAFVDSMLGRWDSSVAYAQSALDLGGELGDHPGVPFAHEVLATIARYRGDFAECERQYELALDGYRRHAVPFGELSVLGGLVSTAYVRGDLERAYALADECRLQAQAAGALRSQGIAMSYLAMSSPTKEEAIRWRSETLALYEEGAAAGNVSVVDWMSDQYWALAVLLGGAEARELAVKALETTPGPPYWLGGVQIVGYAELCEAVGAPDWAGRWLGAVDVAARDEPLVPIGAKLMAELEAKLVAAHGPEQLAAWRADPLPATDESVLATIEMMRALAADPTA